MALHLAAYGQSVDLATVLTAINAVQDQAVTTSGADVRVPKALPYLVGQAALCGNTTPSRAQIQAPSLRGLLNVDVEPLVAAVVFGSPPESILHADAPLTPDESLNFALQATGGAATQNYGLLWLADGALKSVSGPIYSVRCTSACSLSADVWVNGNLTFAQTLPAGTYQVVGMRSRGTNLVASRLVFVGSPWRPGVPAVNALGDLDPQSFRYGAAGVFGQFDSTQPPTIECLGVTDSSQTHILDLVKIR